MIDLALAIRPAANASLHQDVQMQVHKLINAGAAFKMASVPARDQLGRGIAQKASLSLKRKAAARAGTPLTAGLPTGKRRAPGTPLPMSTAGKRLASNLRGGTPSSDAQLRASYKTLPSSSLSPLMSFT